MRNILPWNQGLFAEFNTMINRTLEQIEAPTIQAATDKHALYSTPDGWTLRVDLPGYQKSEISITLDDNALKLSAENEDRGAAKFSFALGDEVETQNINAALVNGVLEIQLPKKEEVAPVNKTIEIQ